MKVSLIPLYAFIIAVFFLVEGVHSQVRDNERMRNFPTIIKEIDSFPKKEDVWVFLLAGQSNMAGRGLVEATDTIAHPKIFALDINDNWIQAKAPLHRYQPALTGLGSGIFFARELIKNVDRDVSIALVPLAVGGTSIDYWLNDEQIQGIKLRSNFNRMLQLAMEKGSLKGILWHQGESDAFLDKIPEYQQKLETLFQYFRLYSGEMELPIITAELGAFASTGETRFLWQMINKKIESIAFKDPNIILVRTDDLKARHDNVHFDGASQRLLGFRYARAYQHLALTQ
ncbi:sialate O-acetylesterase [Salegentibacter sediminis]|uniref:sialate O-acetylesterase n=1 Tax=Salegentibacter sediminis TaxID=1930251 RepID=UPI0009BF202A|nr:sialate O-acetylesterase [Salegentibacter sediminis]